MGVLNFLEEVAGAVVAVEAVKKLDPDAGFLEKSLAAIAGFKGVEEIIELVEENSEKKDGENPTT